MAQVDELPLESFEDVPDEALCVICQMPSLDNVSMCMTGHNACRACANKWVNSNNENSDKCASCRQPLTRPHVSGTGATWMANIVLNNMVKDFQIKCPNVGKGCTHTCKLTEMKAHIATCEWRELVCKCTGCPWKGPACKWQEHMKEEDHGHLFVDMLIHMRGICADVAEQACELGNDVKGYRQDVEATKTQLTCIGTGVNQVQASLTAIEGYTKPFDGSSARSKRRDRKNQKDVDEAQEHAEEARRERDDLKRKVEELEARPAPTPFVSEDIHTQACDSRDRFFRERDAARHEAYMAQQRIHDQHALLKKMMPQASVDEALMNAKVQNQVANPPSPASPKDEEDDDELERTPEFELSRLLDEAMREVYTHLHDALTDVTYNGQELKLGRAYRSITQFQMDHMGKLTQMQTASIACTRDQVAKMQCDLSERADRLNVSVDQLEQSFARMNSWRADDDPMKTITLAQYIDKEKREAHAEVVATKAPPPANMKTLPSGIKVNVTHIISEIEKHGRSNGGFTGKGLFFGVDYASLCRNGDVMPGSAYITCKTEEQWKKMGETFDQLQVVATGQKLPGEQAYTSELTDVRHDGIKLVVQYWVVELDDRKYEDARHKDPRANLLPEVLSGKSFDGPAIVQVWAQVKQLSAIDEARDAMEGMSVRKEAGESHEEHDAPVRTPSPSPIRTPRAPRKPPRSDLFGNVDSASDEEDADDAQWSATINTGGVSTLRHEANKLIERAKQVAELGDHKTAYELAAQGHTLRTQADSAEAFTSSAEQSPAPEEPKVYKPEVKYEYPSGEVRLIEAGYYTESEHMTRSMYEQDLLAAVKTATSAGIEKAKLTPEQLSKYECAISRSMSAADAMTAAEKLAPAVAEIAERTREIMRTSRENSKQSSPVESPKVTGKEGPPLPPGAISFKLPEDLVSAAERELAQALPLPKSLQPGSSLFAPSREAVLQRPVYGAPPGAPDVSDEDGVVV